MSRFRIVSNWFRKLPVGRKLALATGLPLLFIALTGLAAFYGLGLIMADLAADGETAHTDVLALLSQMRFAIGLGTPLMIGMVTFVIWRLQQEVTVNVQRLSGYMDRLQQFDHNFTVRGVEREDEIGQMARSIETFRKAGIRLKRLQDEKDMTKDRHLDTLRDLARRFEGTVGEVVSGIGAASEQLQATATLMANTAESSSTQTDDVARAMEEASTGVTAAAAASDEFAMSINEISRQAASSAELAREASDTAHRADETISTLSESAGQVGQVVELIQSIAQRTNLLALNASIEAARGGEAGRGFAVVASEVKELAAQTSRATQDVARQINEMQQSTDASVTALRRIGDQINQLEATAISIASAVDQQSVAGQDLARSIDLAANGTGQVAANFSTVREASLSTGAAASQVLSSASELGNRAHQLREQADRFLSEVLRG
ncbi:MAG: methyl-accepting chemotaxis protein [Sphingomonadales bacterium]|nr:methyl-accepting chemotaxis protein [Sphingomonadales bacterium]MBD3774360.1 methyl-accepting chemotaxis protein [Paracoccaceae bacterium]